MRRISHWSRVLDVAFVQTLLEENRISFNGGEETTANRYYVDPRQPVLCIGSRANNRVLETCFWGAGFISSSSWLELGDAGVSHDAGYTV